VRIETMAYPGEGAIGIIILDRPGDGNTFTATTCHELRAALAAKRKPDPAKSGR
jgi:enoyl-CoA hydratase/carnithine racemase